MKKRVLSLLLCLVMALSLIPTVAFAATHIDTVKINGVKTPRIGAKAGSFLRLTTPDSTYTIVKSYWVCSGEGGGALDDNGVFEEGKEYSLCVTVMPANGYYLDRNTEFVFNGGAIATQVSSKDASADGSLYRNTMPMAAANEAVDTVNIIGIKMPMSGVKAGDNLKGLMPASAGYTIAEAVWMCLEDNYFMTDDDVFETGKTYVLDIGVRAKKGYTLNIDTGFIFNSGAVEAWDDYYKNMDGDELYYFTAPIEAKVYIDTVNITGVKTPAVGAKAGDFLNLSTAASTYTIAGADWHCKTDSRVLFSGDAFEAEKDYYLGVELTPADGYIMDDSTKVLFNGGAITADSSTWVSSDGHLHGFTIPATIGKKYNVTFNMNGYGTAPAAQTVLSGSKAVKPADPTESGWAFGGWYTDESCTTPFDFNTPITGNIALYAKWTDNRTTINSINITVDTPIVGKSTAESVFVPTVTTDPADAVYVNMALTDWYNNGCSGEYTGIFQANTEYNYEICLIAKEGYRFPSVSCNDMALANGAAVKYVDAGTNGGYAFIGIVMTPTCTHINTEVKDAIAPTCTTDGKTAGTICTDCQTVLSGCTVVPAHSYDAGKVTKTATCSAAGVKTYTCTVCGATKTETIAKVAHTPQNVVAIASTCTATGKTAGTICSVCKAVISGCKDVPVKEHTVVADKAVAATYTKTGKTEGSHCSVCGKVLTKQTTVAMQKLAQAKITSITNTKDGITVKWNKVTGATAYQVYRKVGTGSWKLIKTTTSTSVSNSSLTNGTKYQYKVRAVAKNSAGKVVNTGAFSAIKTMYRLTRPTLASGTKNIATRKIVVKWNKNTKVTGYQVKYIKGTTTKTVTVKGASSLTKTLSSLTKGATYKVYVRSYKTVSGTNYYSAWSAYKSVKVAK